MYAVIGANGFLGSYLVKSILDNTQDNVIAVARNLDDMPVGVRIRQFKCDVTKNEDVAALADIIRAGEPCKLIYLAAYHNIDLVAQNPKTAWNINITSLASFLNTIDNLRCFFFSSTDCVYGEGKPDYRFKESDPLQPVSLYGVHKIAAESLVTAKEYTVLRLPFMFGPSLSGQKKHFYDKIAEDIQQGKTVELFSDSLRSTLDYGAVADIMIKLAENYPNVKMPKIMNLCGDDSLSKYDLGLMMANKFGCSPELIVPVSAENSTSIFLAKRALAGLMDNSLLKSTLGINQIKLRV